MTFGNLIIKARGRKSFTIAEMAARLHVTERDYERLEGGHSDAERWGPLLARLAVALDVPMSRLLTAAGQPVGVGASIARHRLARQRSPEDLARAVVLGLDEYHAIESGSSPIESVGPLVA